MSRVIIVHTANWTQLLGGAELQLYLLAKTFKEEGYKVLLASPMRRGESNGMQLDIIYHRLPFLAIKGYKVWLISMLGVIPLLRKKQRQIVISRGNTGIALASAIMSRLRGAKFYWFVASDRDLEKLGFLAMIRKYILVKYAHKIFVQNSVQQNLVDVKELSRLVKIGQRLPYYRPRDFRPKNKFRIIWIGNEKPIKRLDKFVELAKLFTTYDHLDFVVVGNEPRTIPRLSNVSFLGKLPIHEVYEVLSNSSILVNTSDYEGFSNTFIQAWQCGVYVISMNSNPDNLLDITWLGRCEHSLEKIREIFLSDMENIHAGIERRIEYANKHHTWDDNILSNFEF